MESRGRRGSDGRGWLTCQRAGGTPAWWRNLRGRGVVGCVGQFVGGKVGGCLAGRQASSPLVWWLLFTRARVQQWVAAVPQGAMYHPNRPNCQHLQLQTSSQSTRLQCSWLEATKLPTLVPTQRHSHSLPQLLLLLLMLRTTSIPQTHQTIHAPRHTCMTQIPHMLPHSTFSGPACWFQRQVLHRTHIVLAYLLL